jgi:hypothetical protein
MSRFPESPIIVYGPFCEICRHILDWEPEPEFKEGQKHLFQHHSSIFDLKRSADGGCRLCRRVYDSIPGADLSAWLVQDDPSKEEQEIKCELKIFLGDVYDMSFTCNALSRIRDPTFCGFMWQVVLRDQDALASCVELQNIVSNAPSLVSSDIFPKLYGMYFRLIRNV